MQSHKTCASIKFSLKKNKKQKINLQISCAQVLYLCGDVIVLTLNPKKLGVKLTFCHLLKMGNICCPQTLLYRAQKVDVAKWGGRVKFGSGRRSKQVTFKWVNRVVGRVRLTYIFQTNFFFQFFFQLQKQINDNLFRKNE